MVASAAPTVCGDDSHPAAMANNDIMKSFDLRFTPTPPDEQSRNRPISIECPGRPRIVGPLPLKAPGTNIVAKPATRTAMHDAGRGTLRRIGALQPLNKGKHEQHTSVFIQLCRVEAPLGPPAGAVVVGDYATDNSGEPASHLHNLGPSLNPAQDHDKHILGYIFDDAALDPPGRWRTARRNGRVDETPLRSQSCLTRSRHRG